MQVLAGAMGVLTGSRRHASSSARPYDSVTNITAAYGVRRLLTSYTGYAMRLGRVADAATLDVGFDVSGNLNESAVLAFAGAGSAYVTILYDQSGLANNLLQTRATGVIVVNAGTANRIGTRLSMKFSSGGYLVSASAIATAGTANFGVFAVYQELPSGGYGVVYSAGNTGRACHTIGHDNAGNRMNYSTTGILSGATMSVLAESGYCDFDGTQRNLYVGGVNNAGGAGHTAAAVSPGVVSPTDMALMGGDTYGSTFEGYISEVVYCTSAQPSKIAGVAADHAAYYGATQTA